MTAPSTPYLRSFSALLALSLGLMLGVGDAQAGDDKKSKAPSKGGSEPALVESGIKVEPIAFGTDLKAVLTAYEKLVDKDHKAEFDKAEPGVEMRRLEEKVQTEKEALRKNLLNLAAPPSNLDGTKFVGEFSYGNKEAVLKVDRPGKKQALFFIQNKLWKIIDIYTLGEKSKWGADFAAAVKKLEERIEVKGRALKADPAAGRATLEVDWADEKTRMRAIDWGKEVGIAYVERATEARLDELRTQRPKAEESLDSTVKGALRK
ncbi:MAG: hypothetical protein FJ096_03560 [Deltaproteobacteria bacterium]|nr:hypothetical protein [Deltaproteobacteria bacterium]